MIAWWVTVEEREMKKQRPIMVEEDEEEPNHISMGTMKSCIAPFFLGSRGKKKRWRKRKQIVGKRKWQVVSGPARKRERKRKRGKKKKKGGLG